MDRPVVNTLGLCAGVGMLDVGVATALEWLGYRPRVAAMCEWEAYAASVLLARMEEASLEPCPVWCGDLGDLDGRPFRGVVDVIVAGLPCQPYSVAGKRIGLSDQRSYGDGNGPIPNFLRIVSECRPAVVFCENVPPWVLRGYFRPIGEELSRMGYAIEDPLFVAAEAVGASHKRERVFVLAHREKPRGRRLPDAKERIEIQHADRGVKSMANAEHGRSADEEQESQSRLGRGEAGDSGVPGPQGRESVGQNVRGQQQAAKRASLPIFALGPGADWSGIPEHLFPATKPGVRLLVDGSELVLDESRKDQIRCGGNGCVPLQAAVAFVELFRRTMKRTN